MRSFSYLPVQLRVIVKRWFLLSALTFCTCGTVGCGTAVWTYQYNNARTGQTQERLLTPANVNQNQFGLLFSQSVKGKIWAQPLYVSRLRIPGKGRHNVVFVATAEDLVYAFDADSNKGPNAAPLWIANLIDSKHGAAPGAQPVKDGVFNLWCGNLYPKIGITGTPVIDVRTKTMYVDSLSAEGTRPAVHRLHAIDIRTGDDSQTPVEIKGTKSGQTFEQNLQHQRAALLLANRMIYVAFGSHCDTTPYHGWVFAYDAASLQQPPNIFVTTTTTPDGRGAGVWLGGGGPSSDTQGNIFLVTGNGPYDPANGNYGDTILKLDRNLVLIDYFSPCDQTLRYPKGDQDLGSGGTVLLPDIPGSHPHLLVQIGKGPDGRNLSTAHESNIYVLDRDQFTANNSHGSPCSTNPIYQEIPFILGGVAGGPAYWNNTIYAWGGFDSLKAFPLLSNGFLCSPPCAAQSGPDQTWTGRGITISANRDTNGVVWSLQFNAPRGSGVPPGSDVYPAVLGAYNAADVSRRLYASDENTPRSAAGDGVKFTVPMVANGKVYVVAQAPVGDSTKCQWPFDPVEGCGRLNVYGLIPKVSHR